LEKEKDEKVNMEAEREAPHHGKPRGMKKKKLEVGEKHLSEPRRSMKRMINKKGGAQKMSKGGPGVRDNRI